MLRKIRRQMSSAFTGKKEKPVVNSGLKLEPLENRLLLDVAGYWSELGYRSGTGGGISWDPGSNVGDTALVTTSDGDSVAFWVEGNFTNFANLDVSDTPVVGTYNFSGAIHCRQFAGEDLGWWDFSQASGDVAIANGGQIDVAAGPNGSIVLAGVNGNNQVFVMLWDGTAWGDITVANAGEDFESSANPSIYQTPPVVDPDTGETGEIVIQTAAVSSPSVAVNDAGEIYITYSAIHPNSNQSEIVVKKYGYSFPDQIVIGPPQANDRGWVELTTDSVGLFGETATQLTAGVSNSSGNSYDPAIAVDPSGMPVVVWTEAYKSRNTEIYALGWDGDSWEEVGLNSASYNPVSDGNGISANSFQDLQPDIAINDDGDMYVSWVCWHNWASYQTNGQAGIYVKYLSSSDLNGNWSAISFRADDDQVSSAVGPGIAQGNNVPEGRAGQGWYYDPQITLDNSGNPAITWFGWGEDERQAVERSEPNLPYNDPFYSSFVSYYYDHDDDSNTMDTFEILFEDYDEVEYDWRSYSSSDHTNVQRVVASEPDAITWAPSILFSEKDSRLIVSYVQASEIYISYDQDQEVFVKYWNNDDKAWQPYGRGSDSNGNDVFSGYPATFSENADIAYFEFNNDPTDDYDIVVAVPSTDGINEGKMYIYNSYNGTWSTTEPQSAGGSEFNTIDTDNDGVFGFGAVFDLEGQPEIEYDDIDGGNPVIAFLGDDDALPYVFEYTISSGWIPVGPDAGKIGDIPGNLADATYSKIDVQVGAAGSMLVAYVATDNNNTPANTADDYTYVVTRYYDPIEAVWEDAEEGILKVDTIEEVTYFADFNGYDFDDVGEIRDGETVERNNRVEKTYPNNNTWYYWERNAEGNLVDDLEGVEGGKTNFSEEDLPAAVTAGLITTWPNGRGEAQQGAIEIKYELPADFAFENPVRYLHSDLGHQFSLVEDGDVIIEFDASMNGQGGFAQGALDGLALQTVDLYLYLTVNDAVVDINPFDSDYDEAVVPQAASITPVAVCQAGDLMTMTTFRIDSTTLEDEEGNSIDLSYGNNRVGFLAYAVANGETRVDGDGNPAEVEQKGAIYLDNIVVYQRIISESRYVSGATHTFNANTTGWTLNAGAVTVTTARTDGVGSSGIATDDAIAISFNSSADQDGEMNYSYSMSETGLVRVDFDYRLITDADFGEDDIVRLTLTTTGGGTLGTYDITGPEADTQWVRVSTNSSTPENGITVVKFTAEIINGDASDAGEALVYIDNVDISNSLAIENAAEVGDSGADGPIDDDTADDDSNWVFLNTGVVSATYSAVAGSAGDGAITITVNETDFDAFGDVGYYFTPPADYYSYLTVDYMYNMVVDGREVASGDYAQLEVYLVESTDKILDAGDSYNLLSGPGLNRQYSDGVTTAIDSGWISTSTFTTEGQELNPNSKYFLVFRGLVSNSTNDAAAGNSALISIDDVSLNFTGYSQWSSAEIGGTDSRTENGGNNTVGIPNNQGAYPYNFRGNMHIGSGYTAGGVQSQMLTIPDFTQNYTGEAVVALRYRWMPYSSLGDIRLLIDGIEYDNIVIEEQFGQFAYANSESWCNDNDQDLEYSWCKIIIPELANGTYDLSIELQGGSDLWIDNLVVQSSHSKTNVINPIVKLGAVGQSGSRAFIVGATFYSPEMLVYEEGNEADGKYAISLGTTTPYISEAGYYFASMYELNNNEWEKYGSSHASLGTLNLIGLPGADIDVPTPTMHSLIDFTVGPGQLEWVLIERSTTDAVDSNGDNAIDGFVIHPFNIDRPPQYYNEHTISELLVRRWDIFTQNTQQWTDIALPTNETYRAYSHAHMFSGPNQSPTVAWTNREADQSYFNSVAFKYLNGTWEPLGLETGDTQNDVYWSGNLINSMVPDNGGYPLIVYYAIHLDTVSVRRFVPTNNDSDAVFTIPNNILDFGIVGDQNVVRRFTISNSGIGDLVVQDISFGGLDDVLAGFRITNDPGIGTNKSVIAGNGASYTYNLVFDPSLVSGVAPGAYTGVMLVQTNEGASDSHPFDNFQEVLVRVVIENEATVSTDESYYYFNDATIVTSAYSADDHDDDDILTGDDYLWQTKTVYVRNDGEGTLNVSDIIYTGAGFAIKSIKKNGVDVDLDANDDGVLDATQQLLENEYLAIEVAFIPKEAIFYDEALFVCTDDTLEPVMPIRLLGYGIAGGDLEVEVSIDGNTWTKVWRSNVDGMADIDGVLELGSTVWGNTDTTPLMVRLINTGTTPLTVDDVYLQSRTDQVAFDPLEIIDVEIDAGDSYTFEIIYTPDTTGVNIASDIAFLSENLFIFTNSRDDSQVILSVEGYAVPNAPVIQVIDTDTDEVVSGWNPQTGVVSGTVDLGTGNIGSTGFSKTFTVRNVGGASLFIDALSIAYAGADTDNYLISPVNSVLGDAIFTEVASDGDEHSVTVSFLPDTAGRKQHQFVVDYYWAINSVNYSAQTYTELLSIVTDQSLSVSDNDGLVNSKLDFLNVGLNTTGAKNITIANTGTKTALNVTGWDLFVYDTNLAQYVAVVDDLPGDQWLSNSDYPFAVQAFNSNITLAGQASRDISVTFTPEDAVAYDAYLRIYTNDATQTDNGDGSYYLDYSISGTGVPAGEVDLFDSANNEISEFDFGSVLLGEYWSDNNSARKIITLANNSDTNISLVNIYTTNQQFVVWTDIIDDGVQRFNEGSLYGQDIILEPGDSVLVAVSFYASQHYYDTSILSDELKPSLVVEYNNESDSALASKEVVFDAGVVTTATSTTEYRKYSWRANSGEYVTISIAGPGTFKVIGAGVGNNDIGTIQLLGTTSRSTLKVVGAKGSSVLLGSIVGENGQAISELGSIIMTNVKFDGTLFDHAGYDYDINVASLAGRLVLGDITGASDIYIGTSPSKAINVSTGGIISGTDIYIGANVNNFIVDSKIPNGGGLNADSITIAGNLKTVAVRDAGDISTNFDIDGDLRAVNFIKSSSYSGTMAVDGTLGSLNLNNGTFSGTLTADSLSKMVVRNMEDAVVGIEETIRSILVRDDVDNSRILAGVNASLNNVVSGSVINKVVVNGTFTDSILLSGVGVDNSVFDEGANVNASSGTIKFVKFGDIAPGQGNGYRFGVGAGDDITRFILGRTRHTQPESWNLDQIAGDDFFLKVF